MKIKKLRLKGWTGVKRGLGLDEIEVDFSNTTGLIALAGQNGTGKSTLIENLSPFNRLASRSGAIYQHVFRRDSERELSFEYQGHEYRTLLKIDAQSGKSEGFIWRDGESLVNGKISAYSKAVNELFGSPELFYNSVFCSQNATKLSDMTTGQLKGLFAEFLRLDRLQAYEETTKQKINTLIGAAGQIETNIEVLKKRLESSTGTQEEIERLNKSLILQNANKAAFSVELRAAQEARECLKETIARNDAVCKHVYELTITIKDLEKRWRSEEKEADDHLDRLRAQFRQLTQEIGHADGYIANAAAIHAQAENKKTLEELIESINGNLQIDAETATAEQNTVTEIEKCVWELKNSVILPEKDAEMISLNNFIAMANNKIESHKLQLSSLDIRDPECASKTCSFIISALKAKEDLPVLTETLSGLQVRHAHRANELIAAAAKAGLARNDQEKLLKLARAKLADTQNLLAMRRQELATRRRELAQYQDVAEKLSALAVAKSKKEDRLIALEENKKQGAAVSEAWKVKKEEMDQQIAVLFARRAELEAQIDQNASQELVFADNHIADTQKYILEAEKTVAETNAQIRKLQADLSGIAEIEKQLAQFSANHARVLADVTDWTYIKNACGKNGLQAMEIDGAAPLITGYANDLLSRSFGSLYTVKFRTQDDEGKECLDIVTINEDGEEILLDNLSGGQKVWCLMALRLAMTLLSKEKSGRNFETAFFDELDGALDPENAVNFVGMYKSFMEIGHFDAIPFISHKPECRSMADHVLMFEAGKQPYWQ